MCPTFGGNLLQRKTKWRRVTDGTKVLKETRRVSIELKFKSSVMAHNVCWEETKTYFVCVELPSMLNIYMYTYIYSGVEWKGWQDGSGGVGGYDVNICWFNGLWKTEAKLLAITKASYCPQFFSTDIFHSFFVERDVLSRKIRKKSATLRKPCSDDSDSAACYFSHHRWFTKRWLSFFTWRLGFFAFVRVIFLADLFACFSLSLLMTSNDDEHFLFLGYRQRHRHWYFKSLSFGIDLCSDKNSQTIVRQGSSIFNDSSRP